jgi:RNA polymerase sigma-70 factor (ECF subfamily)
VPLSLVGADQKLVAGIRAGNAAAFEAAFHAHYRLLCNFALSYIGSRALAEEQVQDLFFWVWEHRAELYVRSDLRVYLYVALRNRVMNWLKHERVVVRWEAHAVAEARALPAVGASGTPDTELAAGEIRRQMAQAIAQLPERRRMAFTLAWQHGLTSAQIAEIMGISVKGVEVARARALQDLRAALAPYR